MKIIEYLGKMNEKELEEIAYNESDKNRGVWVLYPSIGEEKVDAVFVAEYNEDDELEWGKIYIYEELPQQLKKELKIQV